MKDVISFMESILKLRFSVPIYLMLAAGRKLKHNEEFTITFMDDRATPYSSDITIIDISECLHSGSLTIVSQMTAGLHHDLNYTAPTPLSIFCSSPDSYSFTTPPVGPSLHPPTNAPPIQTAGTDVLPTRLAISARSALPSSTWSSSTTLYLVPSESNIPFALIQNGHFTNDNIRTEFSSIKVLSFALMAASSYSPASDLTNAFFPSLSGEFVKTF